MRKFLHVTLTLLSLFPAWFVSTAQAQFHAPETEYHDMSQKFFPIEAARVIAWLERQQGQGIAEVRYELKRVGTDQHQWKIRWLDAKGRDLKTANVNYSDRLLANGPLFFRSVFSQLGSVTNIPTAKVDLETSFWEGAERGGYSRMESLEAAFEEWKHQGKQLPDPSQAARMAGILVQTATHGFWQQSALDGLLLARSAAWLCVAETAGATNDALWAPIMFVADREWKARSVWTPRMQPPVAVWWNVFLTGAPANEAFLSVAAPEQRKRAMPMMAWHASIADGYMIAAGRLVEPIFSKAEKQRLYDFAPGFADSTVENGHMLDGWWPTLARAAWLRTLKAYPTNDLDFSGYAEALKQAEAAGKSNLAANEGADNCLQHLESVAPLLRVAYAESRGPLTPVAHVTARDLLHYGWENSSLQLVARQYFVRSKWNVRDRASQIFRTAVANVPNLGLVCSGPTNSPQLHEALQRLQFVNWTFGDRWPAAGIKKSDILTNDSSGMFAHWLRPSMMSWLYYWWMWAHTPDQWRPIASALHAEGSRRVDLRLLEFITNDGHSPRDLRELGGKMEVGLPLATGLRWDYLQALRALTNNTLVPTAAECREAERIFWSNPNSTLAPIVFQRYLLAGEFPAAKAFYKEAMALPHDEVGYGLRVGWPRWILAMFEEDEATMRQVLVDHETGSAQSFIVRVHDAIWRKDYASADALIKEGIERYGTGTSQDPSRLAIMRQFLPSRAALADRAHADHANALRALASVNKVPVFQWILIQQLKLTRDEAEIFLGGDKAGDVRRLMIQFLRKDKSGFNGTLNDMKSIEPSTSVLAGWLWSHLQESKPTLEEKSLRPTGARPIEELVLRKLQEQK